ncbi:ribosomal RNA small subunit methyltransferase A [Candidatus Gracilibacteria bacterium HOT-871]|nr:ribosomal RNA small subunit methyltransferase A [Candidatus Gracilibacteria bacterium HOT-871]MBB1564775.1 ribosomal RNA small subunit methyltransferase A [Candidatus Gracilibacteria bacterium]
MTLDLIKKYTIKAKKSLGQNFLVNDDILQSIADTFEIKDKNIIEVGPGYGALTEKLLEKKPSKLTLIELDREMIEILQNRINSGDFKNSEKICIKNIDILKYFPEFKEDYFVIANIPYYITSPILRHFLYDLEKSPEKMLILMQKDVGDKIILGQEKNGKVKSSVLSLFVAKKCTAREIIFVGKQNFFPSPKVESSVILFERHNDFDFLDDKIFFDFIKKAFVEPRKKLINNLSKAGFDKDFVKNIFKQKNIDENIRPEDLSISNWCDLILDFNKNLT